MKFYGGRRSFIVVQRTIANYLCLLCGTEGGVSYPRVQGASGPAGNICLGSYLVAMGF